MEMIKTKYLQTSIYKSSNQSQFKVIYIKNDILDNHNRNISLNIKKLYT